MRPLIVSAAIIFGLFGLGIQLVPSHAGSNPPLNHNAAIEANMTVSPQAAAVFQKACRNCHSNETEWPWYSRIAPMSWLVEGDVEKARKAMNLSDWQNQNGRTRGRAIGTLMAACAGLEAGRMPPAKYRMMHPEAKLTAGEVKGFCAWTRSEAHELRSSAAKPPR